MSLIPLAAETSKTPFYIAGGVFVAWAVLLAFAGITRAEFPGNQMGRTGVMVLSVVFAAAAMATAVITS